MKDPAVNRGKVGRTPPSARDPLVALLCRRDFLATCAATSLFTSHAHASSPWIVKVRAADESAVGREAS